MRSNRNRNLKRGVLGFAIVFCAGKISPLPDQISPDRIFYPAI